ncbi:DUF6567 family protein [Aestuariibaculum sediminum]|uniref:Lipoprotein n=1 Tax=Aestuariibaculum sediminum TaxID=2770637 RepID=A0A8J6U732_9FLAO|nr:DUF6567 family protein [Aestuariibaculum sediminum]MBD0831315.1 hypothetical protein [Aestuariibaculum sediminum]
MKKITLLFALLTILTTSCATHNGLTRNMNQNNTEVVLSQNNFKIIKTVKGFAKATYILGIGGHSKNGLVSEAKSNMLENANLEGTSRAIINETVEIKGSAFPFVGTHKVIVSGQIIEFTD